MPVHKYRRMPLVRATCHTISIGTPYTCSLGAHRRAPLPPCTIVRARHLFVSRALRNAIEPEVSSPRELLRAMPLTPNVRSR
eukprot:SAG11_NODE_1625_length_4552_cov_3.448586_5_plen_82_part_00